MRNQKNKKNKTVVSMSEVSDDTKKMLLESFLENIDEKDIILNEEYEMTVVVTAEDVRNDYVLGNMKLDTDFVHQFDTFGKKKTTAVYRVCNLEIVHATITDEY